jgi:hypothetical protein
MSRQNDRFSGEPSGEPEWMREFARGGDPRAHRQEESWPAAGLAAYNAAAGPGGSIGVSTGAPSEEVGARNTQRGLVSGNGVSAAPPSPREGANNGGGCSCGGGGSCKSSFGSKSLPASPVLESAQVPSSRPSRRTFDRLPAEAEAVALMRRLLQDSGIQMSVTQITAIVRKARAKVIADSGRPVPSDRNPWSREAYDLLHGRRRP